MVIVVCYGSFVLPGSWAFRPCLGSLDAHKVGIGRANS